MQKAWECSLRSYMHGIKKMGMECDSHLRNYKLGVHQSLDTVSSGTSMVPVIGTKLCTRSTCPNQISKCASLNACLA